MARSCLAGHGNASHAGKAIRDAKVAVLNAISLITMDDEVLGQYEGYAGMKCYAISRLDFIFLHIDDPSITNENINAATFAVIKFKVNTPRWHGVWCAVYT